jgi:hypothetical protein
MQWSFRGLFTSYCHPLIFPHSPVAPRTTEVDCQVLHTHTQSFIHFVSRKWQFGLLSAVILSMMNQSHGKIFCFSDIIEFRNLGSSSTFHRCKSSTDSNFWFTPKLYHDLACEVSAVKHLIMTVINTLGWAEHNNTVPFLSAIENCGLLFQDACSSVPFWNAK